jgi:hypothetical protein
MNPTIDTSLDVHVRLIAAYRRMSFDRKWRNLGEDWIAARLLHQAGYQQRSPAATPAEIRADWLRQTLGTNAINPVHNTDMNLLPFSPVLRSTLHAFDKLKTGYTIGGSIASSMHGIGRMTRDAGVTAEPFPGREAAFVAAFDPESFYVSEDAVRMAVRDRFSFNILHPESGFKIDVFILKDDPFERAAFARRQMLTLADDPNQPIAFYSAEDIVLFKLRWYRLGNESSEQQWNDILGVLRTQSDRLDAAYLEVWAAAIGVADLLERARGDA